MVYTSFWHDFDLILTSIWDSLYIILTWFCPYLHVNLNYFALQFDVISTIFSRWFGLVYTLFWRVFDLNSTLLWNVSTSISRDFGQVGHFRSWSKGWIIRIGPVALFNVSGPSYEIVYMPELGHSLCVCRVIILHTRPKRFI